MRQPYIVFILTTPEVLPGAPIPGLGYSSPHFIDMTQDNQMLKKSLLTIAVLVALPVSGLMAADKIPAPVQEALNKLIPGEQPSRVTSSPIKGVYEVAYGTTIFYISDDGKYILQGDLIDVADRKNLTSFTRRAARAELASKIKKEDTIVFAPKDKPADHVVYVFTDIDCPYCRKLHSEIDQYNKAGIEVRYLMFPRAGVNTPSYQKAVDVWCAKDRADALTKSKAGKPVPKASCENPVKAHMELGEKVGVTGTPAILLKTGDVVPGYRPAKDLRKILDSVAEKEAQEKKQ